MVEGLYDRLAACAEAAAADGIERIAFDLLHRGDALANLLALDFDHAFGAHDAHQRAAASGAFGADSGVPAFFPDGNIVLRNEERHERFLRAAAGSGAGGRNREYLKKITTIHGQKTF